jgi:hypothetical protein
MKRSYPAIVLAFAILTSGCAAILGGGSSQPVSIEGTPPAARYTIRSSSGIQMASGTIPSSVSLPRKNEYQIDISLDGYETQTVALSRGTNGWIWGNLVFGWILGFIVDFATGAAYKLQPAVVNVALVQGEEMVAVVRFYNKDHKLLGTERLTLVPTS